jgi:hypothetical protein
VDGSALAVIQPAAPADVQFGPKILRYSEFATLRGQRSVGLDNTPFGEIS